MQVYNINRNAFSTYKQTSFNRPVCSILWWDEPLTSAPTPPCLYPLNFSFIQRHYSPFLPSVTPLYRLAWGVNPPSTPVPPYTHFCLWKPHIKFACHRLFHERLGRNLLWVIHLCTCFGHTFQTMKAYENTEEVIFLRPFHAMAFHRRTSYHCLIIRLLVQFKWLFQTTLLMEALY